MKKSLKLLSLILILLTISFGWQKNVWAAKKTWGSYTAATKVAEGATQRSKTVVAKDTSDKFGVVLYISDMGYQNPLYYTHTIDGKPAFCLDAPLTSKSTMYAERFLFTDVTTLGPTTPGTHWDVADYALMYLLKDATIDSSDYVNRSLAIRGIAATFGMLDTPSTLKSKRKSGDLAKELLRACYNNVNNWLHYDASLRSTYEELNSLVGGLKTNAYGDQYKTCKSEDDYCWNDYVWVNASDHNQVVSGAKSYYASALTAALEYAKKAKNGGKMEVKAEPATSTGTKATPFEDSNGTMLFQRVEHKLTLKGLDPDNDKLKFALKDLTYDGGAKEYGASEEPSIVKIDVGGTAVCDKTASEPSSENCNSEWLGEDKNLLKAAGVTITEEMTITITIEFKGYKSLNDGVTLDKLLCDKQPMKYTLNYVYSAGDDSSSTNEFSDDIGIVWRSTDDTVGGAGDYESAKNSRQRFLTYHPDAKTDEDSDKDGEDYTGSLTGEINLTGDCAECEELAEDCVGGDTEACDDLKDAQKDGECPDCIVWEALCKISDDPENDENCKNFKDEDNGCCTDLVNECDEDPESDACDDLEELCPDDCTTWEVLCEKADDPDTDENCQKFNDPDNDCPSCKKWEKECKEGDTDACDELKDPANDCPVSCPTWEALCENADDPDTDENCQKFKDPANKCVTCEELIDECTAAGDLSDPMCQTLDDYAEDGTCDRCDSLQALCNASGDPSSEYCQDYKDECDGEPLTITCDPEMSQFACCDENNNVIFSSTVNAGDPDALDAESEVTGTVGGGAGGGNQVKDYQDAYIYGPHSNYACFVDIIDKNCQGNNGCSEVETHPEISADSKDNTYITQVMANNGSSGGGNKYCTVSCKEDYLMKMPTAKLVNAGRYFSFRAKVEGTQTCYTNTIQREIYNKDMIEAQEAIIDAYNEYAKYLALSKVDPASYTANPQSGSSGCCLADADGDGTTGCEGIPATDDWNEYYAKATYTYYKITAKHEDTGVIEIAAESHETEYGSLPDGTVNNAEDEYIDGSDYHTNTDYSDDGCSVDDDADDGNPTKMQDDLKNKLSSLLATLNTRKNRLNEITKEFNLCSEWTYDYNYNGTVSYEYDEEYMDLIRGNTENMEATVTKGSPEEWYCNSTVTAGTGNESKAEISDKGDDGYTECTKDSGASERKTSIKFVSCDESKCEAGLNEGTQEVSDARYKKIETKITAKYVPKILFYQIHPDGSVVVDEPDPSSVSFTKVDDKDGNGALPVARDHFTDDGTSDRKGVFNYYINLQGIGEYYEAGRVGTYGRYVDYFATDDMAGKLAYNCKYLVNIVIDGKTFTCEDEEDPSCPDCPSGCIPPCGPPCEGDDCISECISIGCIYDDGDTYYEKPISLNNMFPSLDDSEEPASYNWSNEKGSATREEIEEIGNGIYESDPILSITVDPALTRKMKENVEKDLDDSGYANSKTMRCVDISDASGNTYEKAVCYSAYLDDYIGASSSASGPATKTRGSGFDRPGVNEYFTLWSGTINDLEMLGPAWK